MKWLARLSREAVRQMQPLVPQQARGVTIFTYHLVGAGTRSVVDLPVEAFRTQIAELREFAHVVSLDEAVQRLETASESARPLVVITFDDGFDNFRTCAWPVLQELGVPCTFYVPIGFINGTSGTPLRGAEELEPIGWHALNELARDPLMTIGSHSWCHQDLRKLRIDELLSDLRQSRECLQDRTGKPIEHFCYPQAKWSRAVEQHVATVYRTAVVAGGRRNTASGFHPLRLGRVPVRADMPVRLAPAVRSAVWLEEWAASLTRSFT